MPQSLSGAFLLACWCWVSFTATAAAAVAGAVGIFEGCTEPSRYDPIITNSTLYGRPNMNDSAWHDDTWAHRRWGPISRLTLYKAWYYDGEWHDPGEFKGIQAWYGRYYATDEVRLLFGAKRPHVPRDCTLYRNEVFVRAELEWDHIFRYMNFTTSLGRWCSWGFPNVANVTKAVVTAPAPNTYIAALRGYEGKPLPPSLGGFKKRYIVQLGFAWAQLNCSNSSSAAASNASALPAAAGQLASPQAPNTPAKQREGPPGVQASIASPVALPVVPLNAAVWRQAALAEVQQLTEPSNASLLTLVAGNDTAAVMTPVVAEDVGVVGVNGSSSSSSGTAAGNAAAELTPVPVVAAAAASAAGAVPVAAGAAVEIPDAAAAGPVNAGAIVTPVPAAAAPATAAAAPPAGRAAALPAAALSQDSTSAAPTAAAAAADAAVPSPPASSAPMLAAPNATQQTNAPANPQANMAATQPPSMAGASVPAASAVPSDTNGDASLVPAPPAAPVVPAGTLAQPAGVTGTTQTMASSLDPAYSTAGVDAPAAVAAPAVAVQQPPPPAAAAAGAGVALSPVAIPIVIAAAATPAAPAGVQPVSAGVATSVAIVPAAGVPASSAAAPAASEGESNTAATALASPPAALPA